MLRTGLVAFVVFGLGGLAACGDRKPSSSGAVASRATGPTATAEDAHDRELAALNAFEDQRRAATDFAALPPSDIALGPDPYQLAALDDGAHLVGVLRGESAIVVIDREGRELARADAPRSPSGIAVLGGADILVVGEAARELAHYRVAGSTITRVAALPLDALGLRDVAVAPDGKTAYAVEQHDGRLLAISLDRAASRALRIASVRELGRCHGPIDVEAIGDVVAVNCLLDHTIELHRAGRDVVRIHHDGPMFSFALHAMPDGAIAIATGGVEDHPLEREDGGFGYIDSYLFLYRLAPGAATAEQLATINSSELDVVTPKWLALRAGRDGGLALSAAGYASAGLVTLRWPTGDLAATPAIERATLLPGTNAALVANDGSLIAANPLFDAWIVRRAAEPVRQIAIASARSPRPALSRIGELLFFTTLMSPWSATDGKRSRFTCETCHHEGYIDGRVHFTGRGKVHAATRPLLGLFNNRPHFSRALDKTMAQMVHAEFRVANRHNGRDPWFALSRTDVAWLAEVAGAPDVLSAEQLREALMSFLMDFTHRANPAAIAHARFSDLERTGARVFRERCATCHQARLVSDDPRSIVPFERWEALVRSPAGPIVWSNAAYEQTGVLPYVHDRGARVPPLRRLYKKWPYFTNGSARSLGELLERFAWSSTATYHDGAPAGSDVARLSADDQAALRGFLDLL